MILVLRKKCLASLAACCTLGITFMSVLYEAQPVAVSSSVKAPEQRTVYVIDAGHGGEDGGAVAADGTIESSINLDIAIRLNDLLQFCGQECTMIRTEDRALYSDGAVSLREKKASDLKNRVQLVNQYPKAVLISIHQNYLESNRTVHGAQAFCNAAEQADVLAKHVQSALNQTINAEHPKESKRISDSIYIMKNVTVPAVLIECGFLSNAEETQLLKQAAYQKKMAAVITAGILQNESYSTAGGDPIL